MKFLALILTVSSLAFAEQTVLIDETVKTTFSDYGQLGQLLTCVPGYKGGFATGETLKLMSHSVELGFDVGNDPFMAYNDESVQKEKPTGGSGKPRPYAEGCQPLIDRVVKYLEGKERVEVEVHRRVVESTDVQSRVDRKRDGEVNFVKYNQVETRLEIFEVDLAGLEFKIFRSLNGKSRDL